MAGSLRGPRVIPASLPGFFQAIMIPVLSLPVETTAGRYPTPVGVPTLSAGILQAPPPYAPLSERRFANPMGGVSSSPPPMVPGTGIQDIQSTPLPSTTKEGGTFDVASVIFCEAQPTAPAGMLNTGFPAPCVPGGLTGIGAIWDHQSWVSVAPFQA